MGAAMTGGAISGWRKWSWQAKLLSGWLAFAVVFFAAAKAGVIDFEPTGRTTRNFDRRECLNREFNERYGRAGLDASEISASAQSDIAAICARQESAATYGE
jgi:hypothetical protein